MRAGYSSRGVIVGGLAVVLSLLVVGVSAAHGLRARATTITRFAGDGASCLSTACGEGSLSTHLEVDDPSGVAVDAHGDVYIADGLNSVVWKVSPHGRTARFAGTEIPCAHAPRCGDGGPTREAELVNPVAVAIGTHREVYIADHGASEVREVSVSGTISRVAGTGRPCKRALSLWRRRACDHCAPQPANRGDGRPGRRRVYRRLSGDGLRATSAGLAIPFGVAVDGSGGVYITDSSSATCVR